MDYSRENRSKRQIWIQAWAILSVEKVHWTNGIATAVKSKANPWQIAITGLARLTNVWI
jgi:hypothetical protein